MIISEVSRLSQQLFSVSINIVIFLQSDPTPAFQDGVPGLKFQDSATFFMYLLQKLTELHT